MKTETFINSLKMLGYEVDVLETLSKVYVFDEYERYVFSASTGNRYYVYFFDGFHSLGENSKAEIFGLIYKYVKTPIEERK